MPTQTMAGGGADELDEDAAAPSADEEVMMVTVIIKIKLGGGEVFEFGWRGGCGVFRVRLCW